MAKPSCIVLVGPECTGKTTQTQMIAEEYSAKVVKSVRIPGRFQMIASVVDDIQQHIVRTRLGLGESLVIFDRWQLTDDVIYEKYCYAKVSVFEPLLSTFGAACREAGILIVYLTIAEADMVKRFQIRRDKLRTLDEAIRTRNAYETFYKDFERALPMVRIDVTGMSTVDVYKAITKLID